MSPEPNNAASNNGADKHKNLEQDLREMIAAITTGLHRPHKPEGSATDDDQGVGLITLAGNNVGATMHGDVDNKTSACAPPEEEDDAAYAVNSNFQAINNSIMVGGSYESNDPGVHLDIVDDCVDENDVVSAKNKGRKSSRGRGRRVEWTDNITDEEEPEKN